MNHNAPEAHQAAWRIESYRQLRQSIPVAIILAVVTFCGGITLGSLDAPNFDFTFMAIVWFPTVVMGLLWAGMAMGWVNAWWPAYSMPTTLVLSCALQLWNNTDAETTNIIILSNIPTFVGASLILFWKARNTAIIFLIGVVANLLAYSQMSEAQQDLRFNFFYLVVPVALASIYLSHYRYTSNRKFFLINQALNESNEELEASNDNLQVAQAELAKKNQAITDSIRYAKRIQSAILPESEKIQRALPESFVFYRPKDIVSGDFYWFHQGPKHSFFAVVDCTGHGVPGALMSLIGFNGLNSLVVELGLTDPAEILAQLDERVSDILQQNQPQQKLRDGMEMVLCVIDPSSREVTFSSAHRPVFLVREGKLEELKGSRFPIGDRQIQGKVFTNERLTLQPGEVLYLTSDGYPDQFGGPKETKYYKKRFKAFLEGIAVLPMREQEQRLGEELDAWQGNLEQIDDITVAGFRL